MKTYYKLYWQTLHECTIIYRLYDMLNIEGDIEELKSIIQDYRLTYTYLHGRAFIDDLEKRKNIGGYNIKNYYKRWY